MPQGSWSKWRGWDSFALESSLLHVDVVPQLGGRIMNYQFGDHAFLWANPARRHANAPVDGSEAEAGWPNWGGDKVWLAPQGWENESQWAGPPDPVLDGGPYCLDEVLEGGGGIGVRLTSQPDARSGVQLSRVLSIADGSTRLSLVSTMKNIGDRARRWGVWPVTQVDAASRRGEGWNAKLRTCVPLNPSSMYPPGYRVLYGHQDNPQFAVVDGQVGATYRHAVGKIGVDSDAGWVATIDGETGNVLVQQMTFDPGAEYPDGASVEVWTNGLGTLTAYGRTEQMPDDVERNPYMLECELVSPFAELVPGQSFDFAYTWSAANIGEDGAETRRIQRCCAIGCEVEPFRITAAGELSGRFGVFFEGECRVDFVDEGGQSVGSSCRTGEASPLMPLKLAGDVVVPDRARGAVLSIYRSDASRGAATAGRIGELARVNL